MLSLRFSLCGRVHFSRGSVFILFGAFLATGCGGPTTPQTLGPILVCPSNLTVFSLDGNASPVIYEPPQVVAGEPPLRTKCSPESGAIFLLGPSTVTCMTTDAVGRTSSCAFTVTLAVPPKISATRFMAFGNSITEGKNAFGTDLPNNYPEDLRAMLAARYTSQSISMVNKGQGGELAIDGVNRLPHEIDTSHPQIVLIEEGVNDLRFVNGDPAAVPPMVDALQSMVREARARGVRVFVTTLLPERSGGSRADALPLILTANDQIRQMVAVEGATLVDVYQGFGGGPDPYIDVDGLHPNEVGYQKMAQVFFDTIRATLEAPSTPASSMELVRNLPMPSGPFTRLH